MVPKPNRFKSGAALAIFGALLLAVFFALTPSRAATASLPSPTLDEKAAPGKEVAVLAGGCFWCTEAVFDQLIGVDNVVSGFAGGDAATAHYEMVGRGGTNHAESIEIHFNPAKISYGTILKVFFAVAHDPTQLNRQGPDWGRQYRSAIFYKDQEQKRIAEAYIQQLNAAHVFSKPIVTEVVPLKRFYPAEEYHQHFVQKNPNNPYVVANSLPKLAKLKKMFPELVKK